jgi:phosphodiesterase/alkaline phosphatase D-like protein
MWDDHEVANNEWTDGAEDHQPDAEGEYRIRKVDAVRAYHEWLPTREPITGGQLAYNRTVHFGDIVSVTLLETRLMERTDPNANPAGNVFANVSREISGSATPAPADWPGSDLERRLLAIKRDLDGYRAREDKHLLGDSQLRWVEESTKESAAAGVAWQVFAQASVVQDMMSPDLEAAAAALDARGPAGGRGRSEGQSVGSTPPEGHASWTAAVKAWTDWSGNGTNGVSGGVSRGVSGGVSGGVVSGAGAAVGVGGRHVPVDAARGLLALGRYRLNWNFDDWHGYAAERRRFLAAVVPHANRVVILGGDSHDSWAGVVSSSPDQWRAEGSWEGLDGKP